jgi:hypothetical protein
MRADGNHDEHDPSTGLGVVLSAPTDEDTKNTMNSSVFLFVFIVSSAFAKATADHRSLGEGGRGLRESRQRVQSQCK